MRDPNQFTPKPHYTYVVRSLLRLFSEDRLTEVASITVEPVYGYVARILYNDGSSRIIYGNDLGLNPGTSSDLAKDKGYSKFLLRHLNVVCPEGREFILPNWSNRIRGSYESRGLTKGHLESAEALRYVNDHLGWPVYVKPVSGSKGGDVHRAEGPGDLDEVLRVYDEKMVRVAVIEEALNMPDYRVVILDGELISAYRRVPLSVIGDGSSSIQELLLDKQRSFLAQGRDTRIDVDDPRFVHHLGASGLHVESIPLEGDVVTVAAISNLSAGGTSEDVTRIIHSRWVHLCASIASGFNLRLCGVDLACSDISSELSDYSVIEVNAAPGLDHYASSGTEQQSVVDDLYARVLNVSGSSETPSPRRPAR